MSVSNHYLMKWGHAGVFAASISANKIKLSKEISLGISSTEAEGIFKDFPLGGVIGCVSLNNEKWVFIGSRLISANLVKISCIGMFGIEVARVITPIAPAAIFGGVSFSDYIQEKLDPTFDEFDRDASDLGFFDYVKRFCSL